MNVSFETALALRYSFGHKRSRLGNFITLASTLGLVLGVAMLVTVLSVMNGFDKEMRERILALIPHIRLQQSIDYAKPAWREDLETVLLHQSVDSASPFSEKEVLFRYRGMVEPGALYALDPEWQIQQEQFGLKDILGDDQLKTMGDQQGLVLGKALAERLQISTGERLRTLVYQGQDQRLQVASFEVLGIFHSGTELDQRLALLSFDSLSRIPGQSSLPDGIRVQVEDVFAARTVGRELQNSLPAGYRLAIWTQTQGNLYEAIQMSRYLVALIVLLVLVIAAFNLVATLIISSADKQSEIAILKALGAPPGSLARIFALQGFMIGLTGSLLGSFLGAVLSLNVTGISTAAENFFGFQILNTEVYPLDYLPSSLHWGQLGFVVVLAVVLSVLASVYPAWRVSRVDAAQILRYE